MAEKHYSGGCQCGAVRFEVDVDVDRAFTCNCSRCQPMGFVLAMTPREKFVLQAGGDNLTEYLFNKKIIRHQFCKTCGVESFAYGEQDGQPMVAVNLNCLAGVKVRALKTTQLYRASV